MKRTLLLLLVASLGLPLWGQNYDMTFRLDGMEDTMLYIGRHFRDQVQLLDSTHRSADGTYRFRGKRNWPRGIYALVGQDRGKAKGDFTIDGSQRFTLTADAKLTPASVKVKGSEANRLMFEYKATFEEAKRQMDDIRKRKDNPSTQTQAMADERTLVAKMEAYDAKVRSLKHPTMFIELVNLFDDVKVPDTVGDKPVYYRTHYWDRFFDSLPPTLTRQEILHTPQLYTHLNRFFYGLLYYAPSDTIIKEIDRLASRIGNDTALLRYAFDHIEPRYFRSTKNIGWDAVWCHLASAYYLQGRCPWATEGTIHNMRYNYNRIRQSLIGAHGQELWMADTNQSTNPKDWISSHRFPTKYVILWFWDPDCHHCQEQSAELATLYDSLRTAPDRRFEVYAVGYESDVEKWKRYLREHHMPFVNVGGTNVNIDYQEAYNIHGAPTMIILNEHRDIIMNKTLPVKHLLRFFDDYEKNHKP